MMPFNRILIATDGSDDANAAAAKALELAKALDAEVTALSVVEVPAVFGGRGMMVAAANSIPFLEELSKKAVEQVRAEGEKMGITVKTLIRAGTPGNEIIKASEGYDLVVMGTLGLSGFPHFLIGNVAEKVMRHAPCAVLLFRAKKG